MREQLASPCLSQLCPLEGSSQCTPLLPGCNLHRHSCQPRTRAASSPTFPASRRWRGGAAPGAERKWEGTGAKLRPSRKRGTAGQARMGVHASETGGVRGARGPAGNARPREGRPCVLREIRGRVPPAPTRRARAAAPPRRPGTGVGSPAAASTGHVGNGSSRAAAPLLRPSRVREGPPPPPPPPPPASQPSPRWRTATPQVFPRSLCASVLGRASCACADRVRSRLRPAVVSEEGGACRGSRTYA